MFAGDVSSSCLSPSLNGCRRFAPQRTTYRGRILAHAACAAPRPPRSGRADPHPRPAAPRRQGPGGGPHRDGADAILSVEGLSLAFGGTVAFAEIDLAVGAGEIHAVIGPNGAGKSSLINAITGLYAPRAGRVRLGAETFARVPAGRLAALGVARTFQNLALFAGLSVRDNVLAGLSAARRAGLGAQILGLPSARREARAHRAAAEAVIGCLGLGEWPTARPAASPTGSRSGSSSAEPWWPSRDSCSSTSRWPA